MDVDTRIAKLAVAAAAISLLALAIVVASFLQTPKYEASAQVWVDRQQGDQRVNLARSGEEIQTIIRTIIHTIDTRSVAEETIARLGLRMNPADLLDNLTIKPVENTSFIVLTYEGTDSQQSQQIVNTLAKIASERISERSNLTATVYEEEAAPEPPGGNSKSDSEKHPIIKTPLDTEPRDVTTLKRSSIQKL